MEEDLKKPLLEQEEANKGLIVFMNGWNSVNNLRGDFVSKLPNKVKSGFDPENPFSIDLSKTQGLIEGENEYYERQFATLKSFEEVDSSQNLRDW
ncbi:Metal tolerance protein [Thalictrum thalictroides]|uniref:Metal tolerance protein n=1 Tax=Thalictrum thalictroides TaxID=46969 RepID=A0A7J6WV86_THATH|nr:Metal tolerance protein [Thalictrum thalictroides]